MTVCTLGEFDLNCIAKTFCILMMVFFSVGLTKATVDNDKLEYEHKVKIIKYLLSTVSWPEDSLPPDAMNVCIIGDFLHMNIINSLNGNTVNNHKIVVRKVNNILNTKENCQMLYIAKSEKKQTKAIIQAFSNKPVLLLGDMDFFAKRGGTMNFIKINGIAAITVNRETLKNSRLGFDLNAFNKILVVPESKDLGE